MYPRKETPAEYQARRAKIEAENAAKHQAYLNREMARQERQTQKETINRVMQAANQERIDKNYQAAITQYSYVLSLKPGHTSALLYRGICYSHLNDDQKALNDFLTAKSQKDDMFKQYQLCFNSCNLALQYQKDESSISDCYKLQSLCLKQLVVRSTTVTMQQKYQQFLESLTLKFPEENGI